MRSALVTLQTPRQSLDLELPAEIPLRELLPSLIELCALSPAPPSDAWTFGLEERGPLPMAGTLVECEIVDGMRVLLQAASFWRAPRRGQEQAPTPVTGRAGSSGPIGVRWRRDNLLSGT